MVKNSVRGVVVLAVCWLSAGAMQARDLPNLLQLDVFVLGGGSSLVDPQTFTQAGRLYHGRMELGPKFTIGVAVPYGKLLSIETAFTTGPNDLFLANENIFPHVSGPPAAVTYPSRTYIGSLSAVVHAPFAFHRFHPYAAGGVEYDRFSPTPGAITTAKNSGFAAVSTALITHNDKLGINVGVGLDRKLTKRLTLRIDLRDHVTSSPAFGLPPRPTTDSLGASFPVSGRANNMVYTAGIVFHLGKL